MKLIARIDGLLYVRDAAGTLFQLSTNGSEGIRVPHPAAEALALRGHAAWYGRQGRVQEQDEWTSAAEALEAFAGSPVPA